MWSRILIIGISLVTGLNGLAGGYAAISTPEGPFGIPVTALRNGPFTSFLIPGLALFIIIGMGQLALSWFLIARRRNHEYVAAIMSVITMGWIAIQVWVMEEINIMHLVIFVFGMMQAAYALYLLMRDNKYPFNMI